MHWDKDSWTVLSTASTVLLAVWAAVQGAIKIRADRTLEREKIQRELADKERERADKDDPALMRERRAVERGATDLKACWELVDEWEARYKKLRDERDAQDARWESVGLTDAEGLRTIKRWQESLGRNAAKEYEGGGINPLREGDTDV